MSFMATVVACTALFECLFIPLETTFSTLEACQTHSADLKTNDTVTVELDDGTERDYDVSDVRCTQVPITVTDRQTMPVL